MATSIIQVRVDDELKKQASLIYEELGLDLSTAFRIFLKRTVLEKGIPFDMKLNKEYDAAGALKALEELNKQAEENGVSDMTLDEINEEIDNYRKNRSLE